MSVRPDLIASYRLKARDRTYFIDLERHKGLGVCLVINESKRISEDNFERHRIIIDSDYIVEFFVSLGRLLEAKSLLKNDETLKEDASTRKNLGASHGAFRGKAFEEIRLDYPKAYKPWTPDDDADLKDAFHSCKEIAVLADTFQRKPGAIRARLQKLGLVD
jgi:hypothetical protein